MSNLIIRGKSGLCGASLDTPTRILNEGGVIVSPTKVGYIIMTTGKKGLDKKFLLKNRPARKPGVVLCSSIEQLQELAELNDSILQFYQNCWDQDILLGCILPWKESAIEKYVPKDGSDQMMMDPRKTSCFVIKFGTPSEAIASNLWVNHKKLSFASSANPSGQGNRGCLEGIGRRIYDGVDLLIEADDFVRKQQPNAGLDDRHEQGVMVSMVAPNGLLTSVPILIRKGLDVDKLMFEISKVYNRWNYRHGSYY